MSCISKEQKAELVAKYGKDANDSGSVEVQIAILTAEIIKKRKKGENESLRNTYKHKKRAVRN